MRPVPGVAVRIAIVVGSVVVRGVVAVRITTAAALRLVLGPGVAGAAPRRAAVLDRKSVV